MPAIWASDQREDATHRVEVHAQSESSHWIATLSARQGFEIVRGNAAAIDPNVGVRIVCAGSDVTTGITLVAQFRTASRVPIALVLEGLADTAFASARDAAFAQGASEVLRGEEAQRVADLASFFAGGGEQRQPRHRVRVSATVLCPDGSRVPGLVESVSRAGLQVRAATPFIAGEPRHLMVELAKDSHFGFWGLVRGTAPAGPSSTVARLRFVGTLPSERAAIERFLDGLERETRSTDPADAFQEIRRLDEAAVIVALSGDATPPPDWLAGAIPSLTRSERLALQRADGSIVWRAAALARTRGAALTTVLERFDPVLDDEPRNARDVVVDVLDRLATARREFLRLGERELGGEPGDVDLVVDGLQTATQRLERAVAARLPHLAAAWEMVSGRSDQMRRFDRTESTMWRRPLRERRNQLLAVLAGLMVGFALVYTIVSLIASPSGS